MLVAPLMLTDRPWSEMEQGKFASVFLYEYFNNKIPGDPIHGLGGRGITVNDLSGTTGNFNYVILKNDLINLCRIDTNHYFGGHIDLAKKEVVLAAGELIIYKGRIKEINNSSGHYLPHGLSAKVSAIRAFDNISYDIRDVYVERVWNVNKKVWVKKEIVK